MKSVFQIYVLLACLNAAAADPISDALQKGLFEEEANNNFDAAIKAYQFVIDQTAEQRKFAATAVFRLGECYRKLNQTNDAINQYQRVLRDFSDVTPLASLSQQNLVALGGSVSRDSAATAATSAEAEEIAKIKAMIKYSPDLLNAPNPSQTALGKAALNGYLAIAGFLLDNNADVNARDTSGYTPLHYAVEAGHKTMVELLLNHGADVNATRGTQSHNQPLHLAALKGYPGIVDVLISRKANVNGRGDSGQTPLIKAVKEDRAPMAKFLLDHGADVNAQDDSGFTALHYAVSSPGLTELILSYKPDLELPDKDGSTPLVTAASGRGNLRSMELLLQAGAQVNKDSRVTPLKAAVWQKDPAKLKLLLDHKVDPNENWQTGGSALSWVLGIKRSTPDRDKAKLDEIADLLRKHGGKEYTAPRPPNQN